MLLLGETCLHNRIEEIPIKCNIEEIKYQITVSECNTLRSLIKNVVERNINVLSKEEYDDVWIEYG